MEVSVPKVGVHLSMNGGKVRHARVQRKTRKERMLTNAPGMSRMNFFCMQATS
jgi:hypothetical protein